MSTARSEIPQPATPQRITIEEYFRREAEAEIKSEYRDGIPVAMAGGSPRHSLVTANIIGEIRTGLRRRKKPCNVYDSNLLIGIPNAPFTHYPDVAVICGDLQYDPRDPGKRTVINPVLIVEVLSPSTMAEDRGEKFDRYRKLDSLREYVLVFQDRPEVQTFFKRDDEGTWVLSFRSGDNATVTLNSLDITLSAMEIYRGVTFDPPEPVNHTADSGEAK